MAKKTGADKIAGKVPALVAAAKEARKKAYCPYSHYPVGAALIAGSGKMYTGCNIENASFGLSNCAERTAIFKAVSAGEREIKALCVAADSASPCGACRQVIVEFAKKDALVVYADCRKGGKLTHTTAGELLPLAFDPKDAGL